MKVLHLISSTGYHGAENMLTELVRQLSKRGIENHIGVFWGGKKSNKDILDEARKYVKDSVIFPSYGKLDIKTVSQLRKYATANGIDIIHSHKYKTNLFSLLAKKGTGIKLVSTCHNWLGHSLKMRFYARLDKAILKGFDAVVGVSDEVVGELNKNVPRGKVYKIGNGIDTERFHRVMEKNEAKKTLGLEGKKVVGFVGRLTEDKGVVYLIDAIKKLSEGNGNLSAVIVGDGEYSSVLKAHATTLGLEGSVIFTGKRSDTPLLYSAMDVFALPSLKEAFPMVVLEAMACCIPVVATSVGDIPRIIENNISGLIIEPKDTEALTRSIREVLSDGCKAQMMALAANEKVRRDYSSVIMAGKYIAVYEEVLH